MRRLTRLSVQCIACLVVHCIGRCVHASWCMQCNTCMPSDEMKCRTCNALLCRPGDGMNFRACSAMHRRACIPGRLLGLCLRSRLNLCCGSKHLEKKFSEDQIFFEIKVYVNFTKIPSRRKTIHLKCRHRSKLFQSFAKISRKVSGGIFLIKKYIHTWNMFADNFPNDFVSLSQVGHNQNTDLRI